MHALIHKHHEQNADLWIYTLKKDVKLRGEDHLTVYRFGRKIGGHAFCSTCGVPVVNKLEPPEGFVHQFDTAGKMPVNARTINGIDLKALRLKKVDGKSYKA